MRRLILVGITLILVVFMGETAVLAGMRLVYGGQYPDPFAPYEEVMPGRPMVKDSIYLCGQQMTLHGHLSDCDLRPYDAPDTWFRASAHDGMFQQIWARLDDITIGDVVLHWGHPDSIIRRGRYFYVRWEGQNLYGVIEPAGSTRAFDYQIQVKWFSVGFVPDSSF